MAPSKRYLKPPYPSSILRLLSTPHRISRAACRSPQASHQHRMPRRAAQGSSASPCASSPRRSGAPAPARRPSYGASRMSWLIDWARSQSCRTWRGMRGTSSKGVPWGDDGILEVERSPQRLIWWIESDTWALYITHCYALYHNFAASVHPRLTCPAPCTVLAWGPFLHRE